MMMKLRSLYEGQDYGSRFLDQRDHVNTLAAKLRRLREQLEEASVSADFLDLESDKDRSGGVRFIRRAIRKVEGELKIARGRLEELRELWELSRSRVGG